ncbi:MAG: GNAT family N-acetyltransferase [Candidatus Hydrogenedentes bacterium]|nr:GNAT family N-acetyltransferase [Candidatus Hydrogenedentota bacterium]
MTTALKHGIDYTIGEMYPSDWDAVRAVYVEGIDTGNATIETQPPDWEVWNKRHLHHCRFVARAADAIIGWVALSHISSRAAYNGVTELSVYVAERARAQGVGTALLEAVISASENHGIWTIQAGIFPENTPSLALHKKLGFREIGTRQRLGKLNDEWRDVVLLERRSTTVGVE